MWIRPRSPQGLQRIQYSKAAPSGSFSTNHAAAASAFAAARLRPKGQSGQYQREPAHRQTRVWRWTAPGGWRKLRATDRSLNVSAQRPFLPDAGRVHSDERPLSSTYPEVFSRVFPTVGDNIVAYRRALVQTAQTR